MSSQKKRLNVSTNIWGEPAWMYLHSVALGYPISPSESDKQNYKSFFYHMGITLPCEKCRNNFKKHWRKHPIRNSLSSPDKLFEWTVKLRNDVNRTKGSKTRYNATELKKEFFDHIVNEEGYENFSNIKKKHNDTPTISDVVLYPFSINRLL